MINKVYEEIKKILKENVYYIIFGIALVFVLTFQFPYYIDAPGGTIDVSSRITVENGYEASGSFNLAYVTELKATIPTLIMSKFKKDWDIIPKSDVVASNENASDVSFRDQLMLKTANQNAIRVAYEKANKEIKIISEKIYLIYIDEQAKTNLKIGDQILEIEGTSISSTNDIASILVKKEVGDNVRFKVIRNKKEINCEATVIEENNKKLIGIMISKDQIIETNPNIAFHFKSSESGPSGGLMMTLAIYNSLIPEDLTKGKKIVGTGTIDSDGTVGSIDGVKYKLKGAVKDNADLFFVPDGENYQDAIEYAKKQNYDIKIVPIQTFDEALEYLKEQ